MGWRSLFNPKLPNDRPAAATISPAELLDVLRAGGLDWSRTVETLYLEYGSAPYQSGQAVFLPPTTALTPFPVAFHVRVPSESDVSPPRTYDAEIDLHGDAMLNFHSVVTALTERLGRPERRNWSVNIDERSWTVGELTLSAVVFPPRRNKPGTSPAVRLTITSAVPHNPPDDSLRAVAALPPADRLHWSRLPPARWAWPLTRENFAARLNPPGLFDSVDNARPLVWRDESRGRIGVTGRAVSLVIERERVTALEQHHLSPGRTGEGVRTLELAVATRVSPRSLLLLARVDWRESVDPLATALAAFWTLPLASFDGMND